MIGRNRLDAETVEHLIADIEEQQRLRQMLRMYSDKAIAQRHGVSSHTVWTYAQIIKEDS